MTEKVLRFFPSPVIIAEVPDAQELCTQLESTILSKAEQDGGMQRTNVGGWHSRLDFFDWAGEAGKRLLQHLIDLADAHTAISGVEPLKVHWGTQAWANVSRSGDSNRPHFHAGVFWSAVFYVKVDESPGGDLLFYDPRMPALRMHAPMLRLKDGGPEGIAKIKPKSGQIIMFPAWLQHSVDRWDGEQPRISVAANLIASRPMVARTNADPAARPEGAASEQAANGAGVGE